ncbi:unknown protein [Seminavis robusta]|uniref:Uncharacterized protein n=1 Tax=Seminavis robusta TaxID=568900 RepID=A0A9N8E259_9STRA|nr:unknown protein [Seminavis robusta]|eukprot:Sro542_g163420.1 n/a (177) ;mRNA; r:55623-56153
MKGLNGGSGGNLPEDVLEYLTTCNGDDSDDDNHSHHSRHSSRRLAGNDAEQEEQKKAKTKRKGKRVETQEGKVRHRCRAAAATSCSSLVGTSEGCDGRIEAAAGAYSVRPERRSSSASFASTGDDDVSSSGSVTTKEESEETPTDSRGELPAVVAELVDENESEAARQEIDRLKEA